MAFKPRPQTHRLKWPLDAVQVEHIDEMLQILFKQDRLVETTNVNTLTIAQVAARLSVRV